MNCFISLRDPLAFEVLVGISPNHCVGFPCSLHLPSAFVSLQCFLVIYFHRFRAFQRFRGLHMVMMINVLSEAGIVVFELHPTKHSVTVTVPGHVSNVWPFKMERTIRKLCTAHVLLLLGANFRVGSQQPFIQSCTLILS